MRRNRAQRKKQNRVNSKIKKQALQKRKSSVKQAMNLAEKIRFLIPDDSIFKSFRLHGNTKWKPSQLVLLSLLWGMAGSRFVTDAFESAKKTYQSMLGPLPITTYQGMMEALVLWTDRLMEVIFSQLQRKMQEIGGEFYCVFGYVPIAFDGSRITVPRTAANESAFCATKYGNGSYARATKKKGTKIKRQVRGTAHPQEPQLWNTMMWHMGLRIPYRWKLGRSDSSERRHVIEMLNEQKFPENTLFCGDAGFVGYEFWQKMIDDGYNFMIRVGANVRLLAEHCDYLEQKNGNVICWPVDSRRHGQPIRLRLVKVKVGKAEVWLLTSVLRERQLSKAQMVAFYKMRWGIEVEFRGLKQTLDNAKMCCLCPLRAIVELHWSIAAMAVSELLATREQVRVHNQQNKKGKSKSTWTPQRRSLAQTMRAIRKAMNEPERRSSPPTDLEVMLELAMTDNYKRKASKQARHRPRPNKKPLKPPIVDIVTPKLQSKIEIIGYRIAA